MKILTLFMLACMCNAVHAATYYFSSTAGDDSRTSTQAKKQSTPWKTLTKLNSSFSLFLPGDSVLFKCGDEFSGSITIQKSGSSSSPIVFGSYGKGDKPVINGFTTASSWTSVGGGIWECTVPATKTGVKMVLLNNNFQPIGRYPNATASNGGYLTYESYSGYTSITDNELSTSPDWTGGNVVIRKNRWTLDNNYITKHSGKVITYTSETTTSGTNKFGYFIQNHAKTLDVTGEWYYTSSTKKLGMYFGSGNPSSYTVKASCTDTLLYLNNQSNLVFYNLTFKGANVSALEIYKAQNIRVSNCLIQFSGVNACNVNSTSSFTIENSTINYTNNLALSATVSNSKITGNIIQNTGTVPGMGKASNGAYNGITISGDNNLVSANTIQNTGYMAITFSGNSVTIEKNYINNFLTVKDDGGGIYHWNNSSNAPVPSNRNIVNNIIVNGIGASAGTDDTASKYAQGIYMDDNASNVNIANNTVANCGRYGIYIHNAHDITVRGNTLYNNYTQLQMQHDNVAADKLVKGCTVNANTFFSRIITQPTAKYQTVNNDISSFGTFDSNYYCRPLDDNFNIHNSYNNGGTYYTPLLNLAGWKATYNKDKVSGKSPVLLAGYKVLSYIGSSLFSNGTFKTDLSGVSSYSPTGTGYKVWNNGPLDGGTMKVYFTKVTGSVNRTSIIVKAGAVTAGKNYILKFSLLGTNENKSLEVYLRKSLSGYNDITLRQLYPISGSRTECELLFTPFSTESDASIVFNVLEQISPLYIDNVTLTQATATFTNPDDCFFFKYNTTATPATYLLAGTYTDVKGKLYTGTVTVAPYSSLLLINKASSLLKQQLTNAKTSNSIAVKTSNTIESEDRRLQINVMPNPATSYINITTNVKAGKKAAIVITNMNGTIVKQLQADGSGKSVQVNVSSLPNGMYLVNYITEEESVQTKFIKQ